MNEYRWFIHPPDGWSNDWVLEIRVGGEDMYLENSTEEEAWEAAKNMGLKPGWRVET